MTREEKREIMRAGQKALKENGIKVFQKNMTLLECGRKFEEFLGERITIVDYVMFEDRKSGKTYQCNYGERYYNPDKCTLWSVRECEF